jgi:ABC-type lipoprotein export system ATPase subunit
MNWYKKILLSCILCLIYSCNSDTATSSMKAESANCHQLQDSKIDYEVLESLLSSASATLDSTRSKEIVFVVGKAGAGKSTLIKYLQGYDFSLEENYDSGYLCLKNSQQHNYQSLKVFLGESNETTEFILPQLYLLNQETCVCEIPGFGVNRSVNQDTLIYLAMQTAIKLTSHVKALLVVVEERDLSLEQGFGFIEVIQNLSSLFIGTGYQPSCILIFNKGLRNKCQLLALINKLEPIIKERIDREKDESVIEKYEKIRKFVSVFISTKNVVAFSPCEKKSRDVLLGFIGDSPPIPRELLGCTVDSKNGQQLTEFLYDIASNAKKFIETVHEANILVESLLSDFEAECKKIYVIEQRIRQEEEEIENNENSILALEAEMKKAKEIKTVDEAITQKCNDLVEVYNGRFSTIEKHSKDLIGSKQGIIQLGKKIDGELRRIEDARFGITVMDRKELKVFTAIRELIELKSEFLDEFEKLYADLPRVLETSGLLVTKLSALKETLRTSEEEFDYEELEDLLSQASNNLKIAKDKEIIIVLGKTGAGKSTLISYLQGYNFELVLNKQTGDYNIKKLLTEKSPANSPKRGHGTHSCTLLPELYPISSDLYICDTAGFGESRGLTKDMFTYLAIQMAIQSAKSVKAVIAVVEECQLTTEKGAAFKSIVQTMSSMFHETSYQSSFFLVFNKGTKNQKQLLGTMKKMGREMREGAEQEKNILIAKGYKEIEDMLSRFIKPQNVIPFFPCEEASRRVLLDLIQKSDPILSDSLGCAVDTKTRQKFKEFLCDLAIDGKKNIDKIQSGKEKIKSLEDDIVKEYITKKEKMQELKEYLYLINAEEQLNRTFRTSKRRNRIILLEVLNRLFF